MPSDLHVFLLRYQSFISILFYILSAIYLKGFRLVLCPTWEYDTQKGCKPLQRCAWVTTQWPSHDRRQGGWHEHEQRGHPRSVILKREKWRLRPFSFGWVTAQLHDLWPGESRGARGHLRQVRSGRVAQQAQILFRLHISLQILNGRWMHKSPGFLEASRSNLFHTCKEQTFVRWFPILLLITPSPHAVIRRQYWLAQNGILIKEVTIFFNLK